jgi:hypothetical protein
VARGRRSWRTAVVGSRASCGPALPFIGKGRGGRAWGRLNGEATAGARRAGGGAAGERLWWLAVD